MLQVDEVTSEWSVLLAMGDAENARLLAVILDGFGYRPLECRDRDCVFKHLSQTTPFAALVDLRLEAADEICKMVRERGGIAMVILVGEEEEDPQAQASRLQADGWESAASSPEKLLLTLRRLANQH